MKIRFYNARILTMEKGCNELMEGELWTEDDKISYLGESCSSDGDWDREIDCQNNILMPGFKNAHTHTAMVFLRSYADDLPLQEWLYDRVFPMEAKLTKEDQYELIKLGILEYLTSGITSNFDMYLDNECHAKASMDMGFRTVLCGSMNDFGGTVPEIEQEYLTFNSMHPLISGVIGFHAEYTTSKGSIEKLAALAEKYQAPVYLHLSETEKEVEECKKRYGMSPVKFLDSVGIFKYGGGGFHGVWMDDEDMEICHKRGISIVSNPCSNAKLASGFANLVKMCGKEINVALGTDGAASNNALDMFREMYLAAVLPKVTNHDAAAMDAGEVLRMATVGGAKAMLLPDCDTLSVGKQADLIMIDMHRPNMQPENHIIKNIVYSGSKENVKITMVAGKILYENGEFFVGEPAEDIYRKANEIIKRIAN